MDQKVFRNGNSLAVTIPSEFAKTLGIQTGQEAEVRADPTTASITFVFKSSAQMTLLAKK